MSNRLSLEKELQSYRVLHTPTMFSIKQHWVQQTFQHCRLSDCTEEERQNFMKVLNECQITWAPNVKTKDCQMITFEKLVNDLSNPQYKDTKKIERPVIYTSSNGERPVGKTAFDIWGGFQVIDMDIKDAELSEWMKPRIFQRLKKYNWFLGVVLSSSGKGLHIYTKIQVPLEIDSSKKKLLYLTNFRHKYSFIYLACLKVLEGSKYTKEDLVRWMDLSMFKPQQAAFVPYDKEPYISTSFFEDFIYVNFDNVEDMGHPDVDWVAHPDLKEIFKRWEWFEDDSKAADIEILENSSEHENVHGQYHYKHFERWKLANTLVKLYGLDKGYKYLRSICTNDVKSKELQADCNTAKTHEKPIDPWAINRLNKFHGFNIKVKIDEKEADISELYESTDSITENPCLIVSSKNTHEFYIKKDEYLTSIKDKILSNIGRLTLIEAGAGTGKTEMVKSMANDGKRVMMVMPFTSTIKSKVEGDEKWDWAYGNRKVRLDGDQCVSLTIDKFSHLNLMEIKESGFDYIFIDESHLMFQSEYRPVMAKVIEMIRNTEVPIILMSGTPIGETVFFPDIVHIRVIKEETRIKKIDVCLTEKPEDNLLFMCREMAEDIHNGKRVLFPTNKGTLYKDQIEACIKYFLEDEFFHFDPFKLEYYKKSNVGEEFMDKINFEKTTDDVDVLMCSTFLSVGVDILDKYDFTVYFNELWMPQEIEQFANRLRNHDLFIKMFINRKNSEGESLNVCSFKPCNFQLDLEEKRDVQAIVQLCNAMIERNPVEYKYNSLISSIIHENKFIEYNEMENKYYVNDISYKTIFFERKYRAYVQQLPVVVRGMQSYGYEYNSTDKGIFKFENGLNVTVKELMKDARSRRKEDNTKDINELLALITESRLSIYKDVLNGMYAIKKGKMWKEDTDNKTMTVKNAEVFEKVVPLFVSMTKMFDVDDIKDIFHHCMDTSGNYNFSAIQRIRVLTNLVYNEKKHQLDIPIQRFMKDTAKLVKKINRRKEKTITKTEFEKFITDHAEEYAKEDSKGAVKIYLSALTMERITKSLTNIFKCLVSMGRPTKGSMTLKQNELLWTEREVKEGKANDLSERIYFLGEFLDSVSVEKSNSEANEEDENDED